MKKVIINLLLSLLPFMLSSQSLLDKFDFGGGIVIGTNADINDALNRTNLGLGLQGRVDYAITDNITIAPNYTYYITTPPDGVDFSLSQINLNGQIYLAYSETTGIYLVAGASYFSSERKSEALSEPTLNNAYGINIGAGLNVYNNAYIELKYDSSLGQIQLGIGYLLFRRPKILPK